MGSSVYHDDVPVAVYRHVYAGLTMEDTAAAIGVTPHTIRAWYRIKDAVRNAVTAARADRERHFGINAATAAKTGRGGSMESFMDYVERQLPDELIPIWEKIHASEDHTAADTTRIENRRAARALLVELGLRQRQHLFLHALVVTHFNRSEACRLTALSPEVVAKWEKRDHEFAKLCRRVHAIKKDWAEGQLFARVSEGDTAATIFLNRAINKDRGYDPKTVVKHEGGVLHGHVDLDKIPLTLEQRREILAAHRKAQEAADAIPDAEVLSLPPHAEDDDDA